MPAESAFHIPTSPIAFLGTLTLMCAFLVAAYAGAVGIVGHRQARPRLVTSSLYAAWAFTALMTLASALMIYAFVSHDYRIKYVAHYSDSTMPLFYKLTAYWGGLDGSLMFWVFVLSLFSAAALFFNRKRHRDMIGYVVATIMAVALFFMALLLYSKNPFTTFLSTAPTEGQGLSPLLQTYWMAIHPPSLYTGYVGMTIPFAFCVAALASGRLDDSWLHSVRVWVIIPWWFLTLGLTLGGIWAYEELGWGGFWAWDPVENAGLLPWFTATAFLHSVLMQERRGMLKIWNVVLIIITFFLTIFGTFMTRSGVVSSVHAFGQDNELALLFLLFMCVMVVVAVGLLLYRLPALRSTATLESFVSREFAFLLNNWILLIAAFWVLFLTMFPTLSEYIVRERITVGPPVFNKYMAPVGLLLLMLAAIAPLLAWRRTSDRKLFEQFIIPLSVTAAVVILIAVLWRRSLELEPFLSVHLLLPLPIMFFGLIAFNMATIAQEFIRGGLVRQRQSGSDFFSALIGAIFTKRRKYGGYVVHLGIAMMFLGFVGKYYSREKAVTLDKPGATFQVYPYTFVYDDLRITGDEYKDAYTAKVTVMRGKEKVASLYPARWKYKVGQGETTTEVAIRRGMGHDVYLVLNGFDPGQRTANFTVYINPLVNWLWLGFGVLAFGTGICLFPEWLVSALKPRRRPVARYAQAAVVLAVFFGVFAGLAALARAQGMTAPKNTPQMGHVEIPGAQETRDVPPIVRKLWRGIGCMCGGCNKDSLNDCRCWLAAQERDRIMAMAAGRNLNDQNEAKKFYDEVIADQMARYGGQQVLLSPIDRGFNRLAWIIPVGATVCGVILVVFLARNWVRRGRGGDAAPVLAAAGGPPAAATPAAAPQDGDEAYEDKLDDELDDLD